MFFMILRRIVAMLPVVVTVALLVFFMVRLTPGDPASMLAGEAATPEQIEAVRRALALDQPIWTQLIAWAGNLVQGDLGTSIFTRMPVTELISQRAGPTVALTLSTIVFSTLVAVPLGVLAAWLAGSWLDRLIMFIAVLGFSFPVFVLGYLLIYQFGLTLRLFPTQGYVSPFESITRFASHMVLPVLTLSTVYIALITRVTRASMLEVLGDDFIRTARAKGQKERIVLFHHALKNAAIPVVTMLGVGFAMLLGGAVVTETVFNIPGLGRVGVDAILRRDYPVVQGLIIVLSVVYVSVNTIIDISYILIDPRIK